MREDANPARTREAMDYASSSWAAGYIGPRRAIRLKSEEESRREELEKERA